MIIRYSSMPSAYLRAATLAAFTNDITLFASRVKGFRAQSLMHMRIVNIAQNSFLISLNIMMAIRIISTTKPARLM